MRKYNPQKEQDKINEVILNEYYIESGFNEDCSEYNKGKNSWLKGFLPRFTHQDTVVKEDSIRLQGWFKPLIDEEFNIFTPSMEVECFSSEYGLYITLYLRKND